MLLVICFTLTPLITASALDDDELDGLSADTLVIKVGYFGGPYYEKALFSLDELWAMDVVYTDFTFLDNMPSVVISHVAGVRLSDLMAAAGIDVGSIQSFYFWTRDKSSDYYTSFTKTALIDTPRYCYYSLPDNWDQEWGEANEYADSYGVPVDTLIALADDWTRCIAGATFGSDYMNLNTNTRFRLVFGQTNTTERTASRSAKWIHEIVVELGGAPTLTLDASALDGEVGSVLRTEAVVGGESAVLQHEQITWASCDEGVASVDEHGNITVHSEGTAVITATFAGITASVVVSGSKTAEDDAAEQVELIIGGNDSSDDGLGGGGSGSGGENIDSTPSEEPESDVSDQGTGDATNDTQLSALDSQLPLVPAGSVGDAVPIAAPAASAETVRGGVQNWRVFEMSPTAVELPEIISDNPLSGAAAVSAAVLFALSGLGYAVWFKRGVRR